MTTILKTSRAKDDAPVYVGTSMRELQVNGASVPVSDGVANLRAVTGIKVNGAPVPIATDGTVDLGDVGGADLSPEVAALQQAQGEMQTDIEDNYNSIQSLQGQITQVSNNEQATGQLALELERTTIDHEQAITENKNKITEVDNKSAELQRELEATTQTANGCRENLDAYSDRLLAMEAQLPNNTYVATAYKGYTKAAPLTANVCNKGLLFTTIALSVGTYELGFYYNPIDDRNKTTDSAVISATGSNIIAALFRNPRTGAATYNRLGAVPSCFARLCAWTNNTNVPQVAETSASHQINLEGAYHYGATNSILTTVENSAGFVRLRLYVGKANTTFRIGYSFLGYNYDDTALFPGTNGSAANLAACYAKCYNFYCHKIK